MLRCPACVKKDMAVLELNAIEIDYCLSCRGIWLDAGELEALVGTPERGGVLAASLSDGEGPVAESIRPCPICGRPMIKTVFTTGTVTATIDRCPAEHGIWFDDGELETILACAGCDDDDPVRALLRDMFRARITTTQGG